MEKFFLLFSFSLSSFVLANSPVTNSIEKSFQKFIQKDYLPYHALRQAAFVVNYYQSMQLKSMHPDADLFNQCIETWDKNDSERYFVPKIALFPEKKVRWWYHCAPAIWDSETKKVLVFDGFTQTKVQEQKEWLKNLNFKSDAPYLSQMSGSDLIYLAGFRDQEGPHSKEDFAKLALFEVKTVDFVESCDLLKKMIEGPSKSYDAEVEEKLKAFKTDMKSLYKDLLAKGLFKANGIDIEEFGCF